MFKRLSCNLLIFILMVSLCVFLNACAKQVVQEEESLTAEDSQLREAEAEEAAREARIKEEELRKQKEREEAALREEDLQREETARREASARIEAQLREEFENKDIHFDFDEFSLGDEAIEILAEKTSWLLENPAVTIEIEGHCDERGTNEYNMALGERRANSALKYLVNSGVEGHRVSTISYGEEDPLDLGSNEDAWAKNRRGHFRILSKP